MALDFPDSPSNNDRYAGFTYDSTTGAWRVTKELVTGSPVASGGTEVVAGGYRYHTFTSSGTLTVTSPGDLEVLMVAGGGGGGSGNVGLDGAGGGGGAGGLIQQTVTVTAQAYSIVVGNGGAGGSNGAGTAGDDTTAFGLTADGGGGGRQGNSGGSGADGGCGGGGFVAHGSNSGNLRWIGNSATRWAMVRPMPSPGVKNEGPPRGWRLSVPPTSHQR